jgi:hypothetical protein
VRACYTRHQGGTERDSGQGVVRCICGEAVSHVETGTQQTGEVCVGTGITQRDAMKTALEAGAYAAPVIAATVLAGVAAQVSGAAAER